MANKWQRQPMRGMKKTVDEIGQGAESRASNQVGSTGQGAGS